MARMQIPGGKKVFLIRFRDGQAEQVTGNIPIILTEDITFSVSSNFQAIMGGGGGVLQNILNIAGRESFDRLGVGFSTQFKQFGAQQWVNTDPLTINFTAHFYMGSANLYDAKEEVYIPTLKLASMTLPKEIAQGERGIPGNLIGPGPNISTILGQQDTGDNFDGVWNKLEIHNILSIEPIIVRRAEPIFSNEVDSNGYPISSKVQMDISTVNTATVQMLTNYRAPSVSRNW